MQVLRLMFVVALVPLVLAGCQNSQSATSGYGGGLFDRPLQAQSRIKTFLAANEASSLARKPVQTARVDATQTNIGKTDSQLPRIVARSPMEGPVLASNQSISDGKIVEDVSVVAYAEPVKQLTAEQKMELGREMYAPIIAKHAKANGVPVNLAMAVVQVESNYRPSARGRAGEIGLMQLLPRTARYIGYEGKMKHLYHPDTNIQFGMKYLGKAYRLGGGSTCGTILKYNAGHGAKKMNKISRHYCNRVQRILKNT